MSVSSFPLVRASDLDYVNAGVEPHSSLLSFFLFIIHFLFVFSTVPVLAGSWLCVVFLTTAHSCIWDIRISIHLIGGPCVLDLIELTSQHLSIYSLSSTGTFLRSPSSLSLLYDDSSTVPVLST